MTRVLVNGVEQELAALPASWGALVDRLHRDAGGRGEIITTIRVDGVELSGSEAIDLAGTELVEVETATRAQLVDQALAEASAAAGTLAGEALVIAKRYREGDSAGAGQELAAFVEGVRGLIGVLAATADARGVSIDELAADGQPVPAQLRELESQLESAVSAQQSADWLTVADLLEYEFQPSLLAWQRIFAGLR